VPATATEIVPRWRERKARATSPPPSRLTISTAAAATSRPKSIGGGALEKLVARRDALVRGKQSLRQSEMLERRITRALREAGLAFEVVVETYRELTKAAASSRRVRVGRLPDANSSGRRERRSPATK